MESFAGAGLAPGSVALGSVKSNIGHLKGAAGAAGLLKTILALDAKVLPPSLNFERPNPNLDWSASPFEVNTELRDWEVPAGATRVAGVSAFGFGGTNFHAVLEEHVPGPRSTGTDAASVAVPAVPGPGAGQPGTASRRRGRRRPAAAKAPLRGALVVGAADADALAAGLRARARRGGRRGAAPTPPPERGAAPRRSGIAIDYADAAELAAKGALALKALEADSVPTWLALRGRGIFRGSGPRRQGRLPLHRSGLAVREHARRAAHDASPIVAAIFDEADRVMAPLLDGRRSATSSSSTPTTPDAMARAEEELRQTEITQPAVLATDIALTRLLAAYGIEPDIVMGHSLGEYGALVGRGRALVRGRAGGGQRPRARDGQRAARGPRRDGRRRSGAARRGRRDPRRRSTATSVIANVNSTARW